MGSLRPIKGHLQTPKWSLRSSCRGATHHRGHHAHHGRPHHAHRPHHRLAAPGNDHTGAAGGSGVVFSTGPRSRPRPHRSALPGSRSKVGHLPPPACCGIMPIMPSTGSGPYALSAVRGGGLVDRARARRRARRVHCRSCPRRIVPNGDVVPTPKRYTIIRAWIMQVFPPEARGNINLLCSLHNL